MSKNLNKVLSEEVKRFNSIMAYQEKLSEGHHYKFYEAEEDAPAEEIPAEDTAVPDAEMGGAEEVPAADAGVDTTAVAPEAAPEGDTEIDVTDLVNTSKELGGKTDSIIQKIADSSTKIEAIINKINGVEQGLQKMDSQRK
jgi:hypothetical protein